METYDVFCFSEVEAITKWGQSEECAQDSIYTQLNGGSFLF